jgi:hypothetical protein
MGNLTGFEYARRPGAGTLGFLAIGDNTRCEFDHVMTNDFGT